jgi:hypothetical protein
MSTEEFIVVNVLVVVACLLVFLSSRSRGPRYKIQIPAPSISGWSDLKYEDASGAWNPVTYSSEYLARLELYRMRAHRHHGRVVPEDAPEDECMYEGRDW